MTNRIIQAAIERATTSATKETLTLVLSSLTRSQADGLMLPAAVRRLKAEIRERYGLEDAYLESLACHLPDQRSLDGPQVVNGAEPGKAEVKDVRHLRP